MAEFDRNCEIHAASVLYVNDDILKKIESILQLCFKAGALYADASMLDKASKWLMDNIYQYSASNNGIQRDKLIEDFKKAMRE